MQRRRENNEKNYIVLNDIGPVMAEIVSNIEGDDYVFGVVFTNTYYWLSKIGIEVCQHGSFGIVREKVKDCLFPQISGISGTEEDPFFVDKTFQLLRGCMADIDDVQICEYRYRNDGWQQENTREWGLRKIEHSKINVGCFPYLQDFLDLVKAYQVKYDKDVLTKEELERLKDVFLSDYTKDREVSKESKFVQFLKRRVK